MLHKFLLAIASGVLLWLAWPPGMTAPFIWVAWVPFLFLYKQALLDRKVLPFWGWSYLFLLIWNILSTYWVCLASMGGGIAAILANSFVMSLPLVLVFLIGKKWGEKFGLFFLAPAWIAFEYFHLRWDLSWPWLTLGNVWAEYPSWVQWYEWTGHLGGSWWVWACNILVYQALVFKHKKYWIWVGIVLFFPIIISWLIRPPDLTEKSKHDALIIQPNIDPYLEKFNGIPGDEQIRRMLVQAESKMDAHVKLVVFPETAIINTYQDHEIEEADEIQFIRSFQEKYPWCTVLIGASLYHHYPFGSVNVPATARFRKQAGDWIEFFNSAILIEKNKPVQLYHKSKLVPGVEKMPYPSVFGFLESLSINLGGTSGSLGTMDESKTFKTQHGFSLAPIICYESIYGDYVRSYVQKRGELLCIITNDGWWGNTSGYKQHEVYASLRAIETRRMVIRSANTGVSALVNSSGQILKKTKWWEPATLKTTFQLGTNLTFYVKWGDWPGVVAWAWLCIGLIWKIGFQIMKRPSPKTD